MQRSTDVLREVTNLISFRPAKDRDAQEILCHVLGIDRTRLISSLSTVITDEVAVKAIEIAERIAQHYPLEYALGFTIFMGMRFEVTPDVLIPRPDSESLVQESVRLIGDTKMKVLDLCTGSGCIAISIKSFCKCAKVSASDISAKAIQVANLNANKHKVEIDFIQTDMLENINKKFDIIVCNPPYVPLFANYLEPEIYHEPPIALFGGEDGLYYYRYLVDNLDSHLNKGGTALIEIDLPDGNTKSNILELFSQFSVDLLKDVSDRPRVLKVRRHDEGV